MVLVPLRDGHEYILDVTGAQFGQYDPVMLREDFDRDWLEHIKERCSMETSLKEVARELANPASSTDEDLQRLQVARKWRLQGATVNQLIQEWEAEQGKTIVVILRSRETEYDSAWSALEARVQNQMAERHTQERATESFYRA